MAKRCCKITILGNPITKKNSQQIIVNQKTGRPYITQSKQFHRYEKDCRWFLARYRYMIDFPVNVKCIYYMKTRGKVDLVNLLEATDDILVKYNVLEDDNSKIIVSHDGSRVRYDKNNPRVEIYIEEVLENEH